MHRAPGIISPGMGKEAKDSGDAGLFNVSGQRLRHPHLILPMLLSEKTVVCQFDADPRSLGKRRSRPAPEGVRGGGRRACRKRPGQYARDSGGAADGGLRPFLRRADHRGSPAHRAARDCSRRSGVLTTPCIRVTWAGTPLPGGGIIFVSPQSTEESRQLGIDLTPGSEYRSP